jgi:hypothetical protein
MSVRATALPGAIGQLTVSTLLGMALPRSFGWALDAGLLFGLALACGSTVVLTKSLRNMMTVLGIVFERHGTKFPVVNRSSLPGQALAGNPANPCNNVSSASFPTRARSSA